MKCEMNKSLNPTKTNTIYEQHILGDDGIYQMQRKGL